jgi:hypothetical protein
MRCGMRPRGMRVRHDEAVPGGQPGADAGHRRARCTALKSASGQGAGHRSEAPAADCPLNWRPSSRPPPDGKVQDIPVGPAMPSHAHADERMSHRCFLRSNTLLYVDREDPSLCLSMRQAAGVDLTRGVLLADLTQLTVSHVIQRDVIRVLLRTGRCLHSLGRDSS